MGSTASFQFSKGSRCSDPPPRVSRPLLGWCRPYSSLKPDVKYDIPKGYEQQNSNAPDELLSNREEIESLRDVREELESLRVVRDRETMELVSYQLAIIDSLNVLKKKLSKEKSKNNRLWSAYCRVRYPHLFSGIRSDNNRLLFDLSLTLLSTIRLIKEWRRNRKECVRVDNYQLSSTT